jgi:hypothetical protein
MRFRVLTAALLATVLPVQAHADALIDHVRGFTLDEKGEIQHFTGLVIDKEGRVKQLLRDGDKRPDKLDFLTDGHDAVMMPGLIDAHAHVMGIGFNALTLDLSDTHTLAEAQTKIAAYAAKYPGRPGSSAAAGIRKHGGWAASPPPPSWMQPWATAPSGWSVSMAMPAGPIRGHWRWQALPQPPKTPQAAISNACPPPLPPHRALAPA